MRAAGPHCTVVQQPAHRNERDPILKTIESIRVEAGAGHDLGRSSSQLAKESGNLRQQPYALTRLLVFGTAELHCRSNAPAGSGARSETIRCHDLASSLSRIVKRDVLNCPEPSFSS